MPNRANADGIPCVGRIGGNQKSVSCVLSIRLGGSTPSASTIKILKSEISAGAARGRRRIRLNPGFESQALRRLSNLGSVTPNLLGGALTRSGAMMLELDYNLARGERMHTVANKRQILEDAGYAYSFDRLSYINRDARKVFSIEFVQDHSEAELLAGINAPAPPPGEWRFYFNSDPSEAVKRELSALLG